MNHYHMKNIENNHSWHETLDAIIEQSKQMGKGETLATIRNKMKEKLSIIEDQVKQGHFAEAQDQLRQLINYLENYSD